MRIKVLGKQRHNVSRLGHIGERDVTLCWSEQQWSFKNTRSIGVASASCAGSAQFGGGNKSALAWQTLGMQSERGERGQEGVTSRPFAAPRLGICERATVTHKV